MNSLTNEQLFKKYTYFLKSHLSLAAGLSADSVYKKYGATSTHSRTKQNKTEQNSQQRKVCMNDANIRKTTNLQQLAASAGVQFPLSSQTNIFFCQR